MFSGYDRKSLQKFLPWAIVFLGAVLRFLYLGSIPGGLHQDEAFVGLNAFGMFHELRDSAGIYMPVYMSSWGDGQSALYTWLLTPLLAFNGGHVSYFLCRLPQVVIAVLTLCAVYGIMRRMFNEKVGIISLFLLSICPWHIMMSRWALDANLLPGFLMFGLYFFVRAFEDDRYLLLSALFYGLSLYCYAVIWPVLPVMLLIQGIYCLYHKKIRINKWSVLSVILLFLLALPLILYVLVNADLLPEIYLPFMTIYKASGYRASEVAASIPAMLGNLRTALVLFVKQNTGSPYDVLLPWGLFYDIGRIFIIIGVLAVIIKVVKSIYRREFACECILFCSLLGGGLTCLLVTARLHQINSLFIPLVLCEAYGVYTVLSAVYKRKPAVSYAAFGCITGIYFICLILFQKDYYTGYKQTVNAYFGQGIQECVDYAMEQCAETGIKTISAEKGAQWPRLLLFTETLPSDYLASVTYDVAPAPGSYESHGIHVNTRIQYDNIDKNSIYIIYFNETERFEQDFKLTQFYDWYVAVPE